MLHFLRKVIHFVKSYVLCSDLRFLCCCFLFFDVLFQDFAVLPVLVEKLMQKLFILWKKCQILHRTFFHVSRFILEVVSKIWTPPGDVIMISLGPKKPKNKFYQIISTFLSFGRWFSFKHFSSIQRSVKMVFSRYITYTVLHLRGFCESANECIYFEFFWQLYILKLF